MATRQTAALRELLLAAERDRQPLDDYIRALSRSLLLPQLDRPQDDEEQQQDATEDAAAALRAKFLEIHPQGELLLRIWPEQHGAGTRWERRESFAVFLQVVGHLLQTQKQQNPSQAEGFALRVVRDKSALLEKMLSWSDKPLIEFRALELLGIVAGVSGVAARELVRLFNFQCPAFVKMATRRWKRAEVVDEETEAKEAPFQLRQAYVDLVLALMACPDKSVHRFATKEGGVAASLFKSMDGDSSEMLTDLFARLGALVLRNPEVEHKNKLVVYNGTCVHQLLALLQVEDENVRDTALDVLNALFFEDGALYVVPTQQALRLFLSKLTATSSSQGDEVTITSEQMYAVKVIRNAVVTVGVNELLHSTQAQTLVMTMLAKYPGLLPEYLTALALQLEPQPVFRWFCVASLVQKLLSCSLDAVSDGMPSSKNEDAFSLWCSSQSLAARLVAPGNFRKELSRGIQHGNNLIIYSSLGIMEATLQRYRRLAPTLSKAGIAGDVQAELRFLLPSPEALVSLLLKLCASKQRTVALIYVRALTVFRLYLECVPQAMREVKLDFTKTLAWRYLDNSGSGNVEDAIPTPMHSLIIGEIFRFLLALDIPRLRFLYTSGGDAGHSKLLQMLRLYISTPSNAVRELARQVLQRSLLASDIFGQDSQGQQRNQQHFCGRATEEITFWLESLREGGSNACAKFMEQVMGTVMADPLMYIALGGRVIADSSSSLSPMTVALVMFLNSYNQIDTTPQGSDLSAYRDDPTVVAFAVRILLALLPSSKHPQQIVKLIASSDLDVETANVHDRSAVKWEPEERVVSSSGVNGKKRKRPDHSDEGGLEFDSFLWLKAYCSALVTGGSALDDAATRKKKARATNNQWHHFSDPNTLTAALASVPPADFAACWTQIVNNASEIAESFVPVHHFLRSRADVDILSLLTFSPGVPSTQGKQKNIMQQDSTTEAFIKTLPAHIILTHFLYSLTSMDPKDQEPAIATVVSLIKRRMIERTLESAEAARMCEQLLFFFVSSSRLGFQDHGLKQLCELFLYLLTVVIISIDQQEDPFVVGVVSRIFYKLRAVAARVPSVLLCRLLRAVEIAALRVYSYNKADTTMTSLCDLDDLFQRAGVPVVAVLSSHVALNSSISVIDTLLLQSSSTVANTPAVVLIERVLASLGNCDVNIQRQSQYTSFMDYKRSKLLTRKLWRLLTSQGNSRQLSFFTTGFTVLGRLGGVNACTAAASVKNALVPLVVRSTCASKNKMHLGSCTTTLRAIVAAIRSGQGAEQAFPMEFEEQLLFHLRREKSEQVQCELVEAVYNVFTRITSLDLQRFMQELIPSCYKRVLLPCQGDQRAALALLWHIASDTVFGADTSAFAASAIVKKLVKMGLDEVMSSAQVLGLLLLSRGNAIDDSIAKKLLPILVQSGVHELKTMQKRGSDLPPRFEGIVLMAENTVTLLKSQDREDQLSTLKSVFPVYAEACEIVQASDPTELVLNSFVKLTAMLLRLVGSDVIALDYDFAAHLDVVVQHPCFPQCLCNVNGDSARLLTAHVLTRLTRITGNYTRTLLQSLLSAYSMSLSPFDRVLRNLFEDFVAYGSKEEELSLVSMGFRFGASSATLTSTATVHNDLIDDSAWVLGGGLEQSRVRATIEYFPLDREVSSGNDSTLLDDGELTVYQARYDVDRSVVADGENEAEAYDPAFLLPMLSHFISSSDLPDAGIVQQGLLGVALRATSSSSESIRSYAYGILAHLHESLQATTEATSDFKAGRQVHLLLDVFRQAVENPLEQVPSVVTVFFNDVLSVLARPTHVLYPQVNHFLLARPAMDLADVPMFYSLFNSRAPVTYRQERSWLLHTLRRGVRRDEDVALLIRRHVLPILLSFFTSELADTHTQPLITSILLAALRTPSGGVYLVTKAAMLEWLAAQFLRQGAVVTSRKDKMPILMRGASSALLLSLVALLEQILEDSVWDELDPTQQHAASLQAVNAFAALQAAIAGRCSNLKTDQTIKASVSRVALLVVQRAGAACSLLLLQQVMTVVQAKDLSTALDCAEVVASNVSSWLVQQRHAEAQKHRFSDWAAVLRQVAIILASCITTTAPSSAPQTLMNSSLDQQQRAKRALDQIKIVLNQVPSLKPLVMTPSASSEQSGSASYASTLL
ncbi:hypothetical protein PHYBOEH_004529 [Phytophthora boehmeriae]|uniref:Nucleolar pre-ribosomal-associated protein 1 C-terminal domain-containing protein n=1 Tax=Phytophthora boehmeriae TaxID=109152 RepID=A0A8T1X9J2_9STRA|nr:hypothetical protein PHYBOEH_004529 [Phytophthora boehmeriae]